MINRRNFRFRFSAIAIAAIPGKLSAVDFRETKPKAWTAKKFDDVLQRTFGTTTTTEGSINLTAPDIAENGCCNSCIF